MQDTWNYSSTWDSKMVAGNILCWARKHVEGACGAIIDLKYLKDDSTAELLSTSWLGKPTDWQPKTKLALHSVAVNTNLQDNEGIQVKFHVMRTGDEGKAVAIRITQQLL